MAERRYYVYIMASKSRVIYVDVTGFLMARVLRH
jgi:predicted GIY-YIG superfamily endonuclease